MGEAVGEVAGEAAGEVGGEADGEIAGEVAGEVAGESAGAVAGAVVGMDDRGPLEMGAVVAGAGDNGASDSVLNGGSCVVMATMR